jgi:hypothetical protein
MTAKDDDDIAEVTLSPPPPLMTKPISVLYLLVLIHA